MALIDWYVVESIPNKLAILSNKEISYLHTIPSALASPNRKYNS